MLKICDESWLSLSLVVEVAKSRYRGCNNTGELRYLPSILMHSLPEELVGLMDHEKLVCSHIRAGVCLFFATVWKQVVILSSGIFSNSHLRILCMVSNSAFLRLTKAG